MRQRVPSHRGDPPLADRSKPVIPGTTFQPGLDVILHLQRSAGNRAANTAIQRMMGDSDDDVTSEEEMDFAVDGDDAAKVIISYITDNPPGGQAVNYCVGVADDGDLYISKVNGVTANTPYLDGKVGTEIEGNHLQRGRHIYLCQKFNTGVGSNHAEMCILAAAMEHGVGIKTIYCSGPHCGFCAALMATENVRLGAAAGSDQQQGWAHPYAPLTYGSQVAASTGDQLKELKTLPLVPTRDLVRRGLWGVTSPQGKSTLWM